MGKSRRYRREDAKRAVAPPAYSGGDKSVALNVAHGDNNTKKNGNGAQTRSDDLTYFPPERFSLWPTQFVEAIGKPYRLVPRNWRAELPHMLAVFFMVLLLYAYTTPRLVGLEDDGLFISNLHFFGVAHPPGYPVHTFLGGIFYHLLPFGTPAFKGHFFSGFAGAIACAAIYATVAMLLRGRQFAYLGGLAYGASETFWSQAIIAEVYTLNSMFFFIVLALLVAYAGHAGRSGRNHRRLFCALTFAYGLGLANHYPILGLGSIGLGLMALPQFRNIISNVFLGLMFLILGAVPPFLWMVGRSHVITPANFYGPIESFEQFLFYVLRKGYSGVDKQAGVGWEDKLIFFESLVNDMVWQFTPLGFVFVVLGFIAMSRSRYNWLWLSLTVSWFMSSLLLVFLLDFKAEFIWLSAFRVYHLLAFGIMAIWLALGVAWFIDLLRSFMSLVMRRNLGFIIAASVVGLSVAAHWELNNRRDYRWAHDLAVAKLNSVEPNSVLFTFDDLDLPVGYLHFVEGLRPDLKVYNDQGLVYGDRLYSPLIPDHSPPGHPNVHNKSAVLRDFIEKTDRPIYYHSARRELYRHPKYGSDFTGFLRRVNRDNAQERIIFSDYLRIWLNQNIGLTEKISDRWTRHQHFSTVAQLVQAVLQVKLHGVDLDDTWLEVVDRAREENAMARLMTNQQLLGSQDENIKEQMEVELKWMDGFDVDKEELFGAGIKGQFYAIKASFIERLYSRDDPRFEQALQDGLGKFRDAGNPTFGALVNLYYVKERYCEYIRLTEEIYPDVEKLPKELLRGIRQARQKAGNCPSKAAEDLASR